LADSTPQETLACSTTGLTVLAFSSGRRVSASGTSCSKTTVAEKVGIVLKFFFNKRLSDDLRKQDFLVIFSQLCGVGRCTVKKLREVSFQLLRGYFPLFDPRIEVSID